MNRQHATTLASASIETVTSLDPARLARSGNVETIAPAPPSEDLPTPHVRFSNAAPGTATRAGRTHRGEHVVPSVPRPPTRVAPPVPLDETRIMRSNPYVVQAQRAPAPTSRPRRSVLTLPEPAVPTLDDSVSHERATARAKTTVKSEARQREAQSRLRKTAMGILFTSLGAFLGTALGLAVSPPEAEARRDAARTAHVIAATAGAPAPKARAAPGTKAPSPSTGRAKEGAAAAVVVPAPPVTKPGGHSRI